MKKWFVALAGAVILIFAVAFMPVLWQMLRGTGAPASMEGGALPWQIDLPGDGSSRVLGLHLGRSGLSEAVQRWPDARVALIAADGEAGTVEVFVDTARLGFIQAKLVVSAKVDAEHSRRWRERAAKVEPLASGARRYSLREDDLVEALNCIADALTVVPVVSLDEAVLRQRFGEPTQIVKQVAQVHWLYPDKGLAITRQDKARDLIQYVAPADFDRLAAPLKSADEPGSGAAASRPGA